MDGSLIKFQRIALFGILLCAVAVRIVFIAQLKEVALSWDSIYYLKLAQNLKALGLYSVDGISLHTKFPPLLPTLILAASYITPTFEQAATVVILLSSILTLWVAYVLGEKLSSNAGIYSLALMSLSQLALVHTGLLFSELPFAVLSLSAILYLGDKNRSLGFGILLSVLATLTRLEGGLLLICFALALCISTTRRRITLKDLPSMLLAFVLLVGWLWYLALNLSSRNQSGYLDELHLPNLAHLIDIAVIVCGVGILLLITALSGLRIALSNKELYTRLLCIWTLAFFILHFFWWFKDLRFFVTIVPALCALGGLALSKVAIRQKGSALILIITALIAGEQLYLISSNDSDYRTNNAVYLNLFDTHKILAARVRGKPFEGEKRLIVSEPIVYSYYFPTFDVQSFDWMKAQVQKSDYSWCEHSLIIRDTLFYNVPGISDATDRLTLLTADGHSAKLQLSVLKSVGPLSFGSYTGLDIIKVLAPR